MALCMPDPGIVQQNLDLIITSKFPIIYNLVPEIYYSWAAAGHIK